MSIDHNRARTLLHLAAGQAHAIDPEAEAEARQEAKEAIDAMGDETLGWLLLRVTRPEAATVNVEGQGRMSSLLTLAVSYSLAEQEQEASLFAQALFAQAESDNPH